VAFVLLLAVGVVGWVLAKPYIVARSVASAPRLDPRTSSFLADGEKAMSEGDLEAAQQDFDKASVLVERDPRVLLDEARVAAARADILWLKLRLLPSDASEEARTTKAQLEERLSRVRSTADDATSAAPDDPAVVRAKVDALRLLGDRGAARGLISKVSGLASVPETAYVLAALDLAEPEPFWTTVIERLRLAAAAEGNAGRARASLVYALARSGDVAGARAELAKLDVLPRPYPCSPNLHAFIDKAPSKSTLDAGAMAASVRVDAGTAVGQAPAPSPVAAPAPMSTAPSSPGGESVPGEQAAAMQAASQAIKKGDYPRARRVYEALVSRNPGDSEALAGLGDVDRAQGDAHAAISAYKRALAVNPSYMPAMLGVADTEWSVGDRVSAQREYKDIADRFPDGTYPSYVKTRAEPAAPAAGAPGQAAAGTKTPDPGDGIG
jgi:tetratricopeptide (TPR) repeat protein